MNTEGLKWSIEQAKIMACDSFQVKETGEPMAYIKLAYFGGTQTIMVDQHEVSKFQPHQGKIVSAYGNLHIEHKSSGATKIKFEIENVKPLSK